MLSEGVLIMCMFCAAIPMTVAVGSAINANQQGKRREAVRRGTPIAARSIPTSKVTMIVTGGLIVVSVVYHMVIMPRSGVVM